jgi:hypothetical protein
MTTPLTQIARPEAGQYTGQRKLFLVPIFLFPPDIPEDGSQLLERYWSEVRDHIQNLERTLGGVKYVFHEAIYADGEEGMRMVEAMNPFGCTFIQAMCSAGASLECTEDRAAVEEHSDWQRCLSIGLMSEKVMNLAISGIQETTGQRFEHIGRRISDTVKEGEAGALFISEGHRVQFPSDIQVFFVAPPALDAVKRWINDRMRATAQPQLDGEPQ